MSQWRFLTTLILVMVAAGTLGGILNYLLDRRDDPEGSSIWRSVVSGIVASFLVPLFLNMISSNLMELIRGAPTGPADLSKVLVFAGFCLVAAVSSSGFIRTVSDRILKEAREAKKLAHEADEKVSDARAEIQPVLDKEIERGPVSEIPAMPLAPSLAVNEDELKLLGALANGKMVFRTRTGLAKETGIDKPKVDAVMDDLKARNLVGSKLLLGYEGERKTRWYITNMGRERLAAAKGSEDREPQGGK